MGAEENENDDNSCIDSPDTTSDQSSDEEDDCNMVQSLSFSNTNDVNNIETASKYQVDEFVVDRFKSNKRSLLYIGKILKSNENTLEVSFMRKINGKKDIYFSFPNVPDECEIDYEDVVAVLLIILHTTNFSLV